MKKLVLCITLMLFLSCSHKNYNFSSNEVKMLTPSIFTAADKDVLAELYFYDLPSQNPFRTKSRIISIDNRTVDYNFPGVIFIPPGNHSFIIVVEIDKYVIDGKTSPDFYGKYRESYHYEPLPPETRKFSFNFKEAKSYTLNETGKLKSELGETLKTILWGGIGIVIFILVMSTA